ncbi:DUF647 domain-containing protein [Pyrenophora teres f. maculata]|nr:DUF647 domain-containing protein [Pyrenophora teres f. maculata]
MSSYEMIEKDEAGNVTATYVRDDAGFPAGVFIVDCKYVGESSDLGSSGPPQIEILILNKNTGVGVGDSTATPTTALLLSVIHSSTGRIATILFAHRLGTALEPECKMYRFAADIFNDTAMKDSSQETVISLLGMLAGSVVISYITSPLATWGTLILLLTIHLATNYAAVRAVNMHCLNRQRANILFSNMFQHGLVLSPRDVSQRERVFERGGVLRWSDDKVLGRCSIGVPLQRLLNRLGTPHKQTGSLTLKSMEISDLLDVFANEAYILLPASTVEEGLIVLKRTCEPIDQIKAWAHALLLAKRREGLEAAGLGRKRDDASHGPAMEGLISELRESLKEVQAMFARYGDEMRDKGWDVGVAAMETQAGVRLQID